MSTHEEMVYQFFQQCKKEDVKNYENVCEKHKVLSRKQIRTMLRKERPVGLLGLDPTVQIPSNVAARNLIDKEWDD